VWQGRRRHSESGGDWIGNEFSPPTRSVVTSPPSLLVFAPVLVQTGGGGVRTPKISLRAGVPLVHVPRAESLLTPMLLNHVRTVGTDTMKRSTLANLMTY
jgi:hypothetical protein